MNTIIYKGVMWQELQKNHAYSCGKPENVDEIIFKMKEQLDSSKETIEVLSDGTGVKALKSQVGYLESELAEAVELVGDLHWIYQKAMAVNDKIAVAFIQKHGGKK